MPSKTAVRRLSEMPAKGFERVAGLLHELFSKLRQRQVYPRRLKSQDRQIRLLTILPGSFESPIKCKLTKVYLYDKPQYNALSYVWGDPACTKSIGIDGIQVSVTKNLEIALRYIRRTTDSLTMWVDAVCINQKDDEERSGQVDMMGAIYSSAVLVYIWLGEGDQQMDRALKLVNEPFDYAKPAHPQAIAFSDLPLKPSDATYNMPWFNRVWTIQEMVLAVNDPLVMYGHQRLSWTRFASFWRDHYPPDQETIENIVARNKCSLRYQVQFAVRDRKVRALCDLRKAYASQDGLSLREVLLYTCHANATDPRDMVYGVLGLMNSERESTFTVDYSLPVSVVYAKAIAHVLAVERSAYFLSVMCPTGINPGVTELPSWALDFRTQTAMGEVGINMTRV